MMTNCECECACNCGAEVAIKKPAPHWDGEGMVDIHVNGQKATIKLDWLREAVEAMKP